MWRGATVWISDAFEIAFRQVKVSFLGFDHTGPSTEIARCIKVLDGWALILKLQHDWTSTVYLNREKPSFLGEALIL